MLKGEKDAGEGRKMLEGEKDATGEEDAGGERRRLWEEVKRRVGKDLLGKFYLWRKETFILSSFYLRIACFTCVCVFVCLLLVFVVGDPSW